MYPKNKYTPLIDSKINNINITAHCPNTGSMMGLLKKGNKVWVTKNDNPKRNYGGSGNPTY